MTIVDLFQSKKFLTSALASVFALIGLLNGLSVTEVALIIAPFGIYTGSQGLADLGKEATWPTWPGEQGEYVKIERSKK